MAFLKILMDGIMKYATARKDAILKVTGQAKYTNDLTSSGMLYGRIVTSERAHAHIVSINIAKALKYPGVRAVITGKDFPHLTGSVIQDKPVIALDKVRYYGEPVAVVVADSEYEAEKAAGTINIEYMGLHVVNSPTEAYQNRSFLVHEGLEKYKLIGEAYPQPGTNIANLTKIRKGDMKKGWAESQVNIEAVLSFPQSDHTAMETRSSAVEISADGSVLIYSSSQSPFEIKRLVSLYFDIDPGKVTVKVPFVGGAFGGKTPVQLELIAYLASRAVGGRMVKITDTREEDMVTLPVHIGLEATVKLGAKNDGRITASEFTYLFDGGAYSDRAVVISRAAAVDCTGPYKIDNACCDSYCMYTNHPYATAFRGFGHMEITFVMERAIDMLAERLCMDPAELRLKNAISYGDTSPTRVVLNPGNSGNISECIKRLEKVMKEQEGEEPKLQGALVRAKGIGCFWKTSNTPSGAGGGVVLTFNPDGSMNLSCGAVEIGQDIKTTLAAILAEKMKMNIGRIYTVWETDTRTTPDHWKTAASLSTFVFSRAVLAAAEDVIRQLKKTASCVLRCSEREIEIGNEKAYISDDPDVFVCIKDIAFGFTYPNGNTVGSQVIGRGSYSLKHLTVLNPENGEGRPGPEWVVGAQAVEVEFDMNSFEYKIIRAYSVTDSGRIINELSARNQITGGMCMGLSFASREGFIFTDEGIVRNPVLRTYKTMRYGENPEYVVAFVETNDNSCTGSYRGLGEIGDIGMPGALANALSKAAGIQLCSLPLTPEQIWKAKRGVRDDSI